MKKNILILICLWVIIPTSSCPPPPPGGNDMPQCSATESNFVTLHSMKLYYDNSPLEPSEKTWLNIYQAPSPIMSLPELFSYSADYLPIKDRAKININASFSNCTGAIQTVFNSREDFVGGQVPINVIPIKWVNGGLLSNIIVEIKSAVMPSGRRLIWTRQGNIEFFTNFNPESTLSNPFALVQSVYGYNAPNSTIYVDGEYDKNLIYEQIPYN